eukprot:10919779-Ditylum_brightwellii.AAC.1
MTAPTTTRYVKDQRQVQTGPAPRVPKSTDNWGSTGRNTRVLPQRKVKNKHNKPPVKKTIHIVPAEENLPCQKIPPIFIPTPKG